MQKRCTVGHVFDDRLGRGAVFKTDAVTDLQQMRKAGDGGQCGVILAVSAGWVGEWAAGDEC